VLLKAGFGKDQHLRIGGNLQVLEEAAEIAESVVLEIEFDPTLTDGISECRHRVHPFGHNWGNARSECQNNALYLSVPLPRLRLSAGPQALLHSYCQPVPENQNAGGLHSPPAPGTGVMMPNSRRR